MKRVPICENFSKDDYNNGNLHEYDPYLTIPNIIDIDWYNGLTPYCKKLLDGLDYLLGTVTVPHKVEETNPFLSTVHQAYLDSFDYHVWCDKKKDVSLLKITPDIKTVLLDMYSKRVKTTEGLIDFKNEIGKVISGYHGGWFMRLSSTSGKNEDALEPLYTAEDVIKRLASIKLFVEKEYRRDKNTYLVLIPWKMDIELDPQYEFRVFVVNGKLCAACPQRWFDQYQYSEQELDRIEKALLNINFNQYQTYIADVYITDHCELIEFNPFGAHSGAGSQLFNWITDYDLLHGKGTPELRYRSAIGY